MVSAHTTEGLNKALTVRSQHTMKCIVRKQIKKSRRKTRKKIVRMANVDSQGFPPLWLNAITGAFGAGSLAKVVAAVAARNGTAADVWPGLWDCWTCRGVDLWARNFSRRACSVRILRRCWISAAAVRASSDSSWRSVLNRVSVSSLLPGRKKKRNRLQDQCYHEDNLSILRQLIHIVPISNNQAYIAFEQKHSTSL